MREEIGWLYSLFLKESVTNTLANEGILRAVAHRDYIPAEAIAIALHLTDRRRLTAIHSLLPIVLDLRRWTVFILLIIRPGLMPLSHLPLGDLRDGDRRRRRTRNRDRLPLNWPLLLLLLLLVTYLLLLSLLLLLVLQSLEFRGSTTATIRFWE